MLRFPIKREKNLCRTHLRSFLPQKSKIILPKDVSTYFQSCDSVTPCKKIEKFNTSICYKTQKTHFGPHFVQNPSARFFQKKHLHQF